MKAAKVISFAGAVLMLASSSIALPTASDLPVEKRDEIYKKLDVLAESMQLILQNYVKDVSADDLVHGAVDGIMGRLDPHSGFMPPGMFKEEQVEMFGAFEGVGVEINIKDGKIFVLSPMEDGPAFKAGILAGDEIVTIGDDSTTDYTYDKVVEKLRGPRGSKVKVFIRRAGNPDLLPIVITRDVIKLVNVKDKKIGKIGVLRIARFQNDTHADVQKALAKLNEGEKIEGLVIDLRNNPGGLLDQAVKVADIFLKDGRVVSTRGKNPEQEVVYNAKNDGNELAIPVAVLINLGSASASEILAGALQDQKVAVVLGERSFGKGSVQTVYPMSDGSGIRITTAFYYTPGNRSIQATGIVPDIEVKGSVPPKMSGMPKIPGHEMRREENIKGHFKNNSKETDQNGSEDELEEVVPLKPLGDGEDVQLNRAVEVLNSWKIFKEIDAKIGGAK